MPQVCNSMFPANASIEKAQLLMTAFRSFSDLRSVSASSAVDRRAMQHNFDLWQARRVADLSHVRFIEFSA